MQSDAMIGKAASKAVCLTRDPNARRTAAGASPTKRPATAYEATTNRTARLSTR